MNKPNREDPTPEGGSARLWAAQQLTTVAQQFPQIDPPQQDLSELSAADRALALAIYRTTVQRWLTIQPIVEKYLTKQLRRLEPEMQAVLMSGAAQLLFLDRLPAYAVVDESVHLARKLVRPNAAGMVNAVLRQVDRLVGERDTNNSWSPAADRVPLPSGVLRLKDHALPSPSPLDKHLAAATSMPLRLVREWIQRWGDEEATRLCLQGIVNPPTTIWVEHEFALEKHGQIVTPHEHASGRFVVWSDPRADLQAFLAEHPERRVQDVAASLAVLSTETYQPKTILDYCAGRGTKTRQLALTHPDAQVTATDTHPGRREELRSATAGLPNVRVIEPDQAGEASYDLVLLDVPCSNTGVLARRPEARYRFSQQSLGDLVKLQREIIEKASAWVVPEGLVLYTTCSIEPPENQKQAQRVTRRGGTLLHEHLQMPGGTGRSYTDGSYHALVRL